MAIRHTIRKAKHDKDNPYFMMSRETAQDANLSYEARGMLAYLLSKPGNWEVQVSDLILEAQGKKPTKAGRSKVYGILNELAEHKYIKKPQKSQNDKGHWVWSAYEVYERPYVDLPHTDLPDTDNPNTDEPNTEKPQIKQITEEKGDRTQNKESVNEKNPAPEAQKKPNPLFDAVALHIFGIQDAGANGGRVAILSTWLAKKNDGPKGHKVGYISEPAQPEDVPAFVNYYNRTYRGASLPRDITKFSEHFRKWQATQQRSAKIIELAQGDLHNDTADVLDLAGGGAS